MRLALWMVRTPLARFGLVLALRFTPSLFPGKKHHLDKTLIAFDHPGPQSPVHFLIIPRAGLRGLNTLSPADGLTLAAVLRLVGQLAEKCGCTSTGGSWSRTAGHSRKSQSCTFTWSLEKKADEQ